MRAHTNSALGLTALLLSACVGGSQDQASHEIDDAALTSGKDVYVASFDGL